MKLPSKPGSERWLFFLPLPPIPPLSEGTARFNPGKGDLFQNHVSETEGKDKYGRDSERG